MGIIAHHAIVVTALTKNDIKKAQKKAERIFGFKPEIQGPVINGYMSFFIGPDGSKEGWDASEEGNDRREGFVEWLNKQDYEDDSSPYEWVEIMYSGDLDTTKIVDSNC